MFAMNDVLYANRLLQAAKMISDAVKELESLDIVTREEVLKKAFDLYDNTTIDVDLDGIIQHVKGRGYWVPAFVFVSEDEID